MARKRRKREEEVGTGEGLEGFGGEAPAAGQERGRLTPVEVQQKVFRLAFRGYNERDVDEFLDQITEDLAALHEENKRLKEQIAEGGGVAGGAAAQQQAEAVVRQAREHAARLVEEAEARTSGTASGRPAPSSYLAREREFLQTLASLVQDHARRLKEEAQRARSSGEGAAPGPPPTTPASEASAVSSGEEESASGPGAIPGPGQAARPDDTASTEEGGSPPRAAAAESISEEASPTQAGGSPDELQPPPEPRSIVIQEPEAASLRTGPSSASVAEGPSEAASDRSGGQDALLSAWDAAFAGPEDEASSSRGEHGEGSRRDRADEPSLRELFWGEE
jgi:DivIVA domain-containing protein